MTLTRFESESLSQSVGYGACVAGNPTDADRWAFAIGWEIETQCPQTPHGCVNPWHWTYGDPIPQNTERLSPFAWAKKLKAMKEKGTPTGTRPGPVQRVNPTEQRDQDILADLALGHSKSAVARKFGVHRNTVANIAAKAGL